MHRPANHPDWGITIANLSNGEYLLIRVPAIKRSGEQYTLYASLAVKNAAGKERRSRLPGSRKYIAIAGQVGAFGGNDYARKTFSCRKHGIAGALRKAMKYRIANAGRGSMPKQDAIDAAVVAIRGRIKKGYS